MTTVTKSDGRKEPFQPGRLRAAIAAAAGRTDVPMDRCVTAVLRASSRTARAVASRENISTHELRELVLRHLSRAEPRVAQSFGERYPEAGWFG